MMKRESLPSLGPKGARLLRLLVGEIARGRIRKGEPETFVTYAEALRGLGIDDIYRAGQQLNREGLAQLNVWTMSDDALPKVAALIVNQDSHRPSAPFFESHDRAPDDFEWWMEEASRAIDFDWDPYLAHSHDRATGTVTARVREDEEPDRYGVPDYRRIITVEPGKRGGRPCIRGMRITVGDILGWLAAGMTAQEIIEEFPDLTAQDIRASLAYAAEREKQSEETGKKLSRLSSYAEKWGGKFTLPESAPDDPRMDYLLEKYRRHRK